MLEPVNERVCTRCETFQPQENFYFKATWRDSWCIPCRKQHNSLARRGKTKPASKKKERAEELNHTLAILPEAVRVLVLELMAACTQAGFYRGNALATKDAKRTRQLWSAHFKADRAKEDVLRALCTTLNAELSELS